MEDFISIQNANGQTHSALYIYICHTLTMHAHICNWVWYLALVCNYTTYTKYVRVKRGDWQDCMESKACQSHGYVISDRYMPMQYVIGIQWFVRLCVVDR